jgi:phosphatidylserine decarboxylase
MTPFDAHYQKAPMLSTLIDEEYEEGRLFNAMKSGEKMSSTFQNEYNSLLFKTPENYKFRIIQIA